MKIVGKVGRYKKVGIGNNAFFIAVEPQTAPHKLSNQHSCLFAQQKITACSQFRAQALILH